MHHDAEDVLLAHQAAVEHRQAGRRHEEHERRAGQHPGVVAGQRGRVGFAFTLSSVTAVSSGAAGASAGVLLLCASASVPLSATSRPAIRQVAANNSIRRTLHNTCLPIQKGETCAGLRFRLSNDNLECEPWRENASNSVSVNKLQRATTADAYSAMRRRVANWYK